VSNPLKPFADIVNMVAAKDRKIHTLQAAVGERDDEIKRLQAENGTLGSLCEEINHALWPDPDASHDTLEAPDVIDTLRREAKTLWEERDAYRDACTFAREACVSRTAGNYNNPFAWMPQRNWDQFVSHCEAASAGGDTAGKGWNRHDDDNDKR